MKIAIGSDHRGFEAKQAIVALLEPLGHEIIDVGPDGTASCDYPRFAVEVASTVASAQADRGILICGTGIGMCMTANKVPGVRAALCHDELTAELSRRHNDANVLCMAGDLLGAALMEQLVTLWLETEFEAGRHQRRVDLINELDKGR